MTMKTEVFANMNGSQPVKSLFERLPNEILIQIFEFLSHCDLYHAMYNLNSRLNDICHSLKLHLNLTLSKSAFDKYCSDSQRPLTSEVYSLLVSDDFGRLTSFHQFIDIHVFTNLRILTIIEPAPENFHKLTSKLSSLPCLSRLNISGAVINSACITTALFSLQSLKALTLSSTKPIVFDLDETAILPPTMLEYLEIESCHVLEFLELLKCLGPTVTQMKVNLLVDVDDDPMSINDFLVNSILCDDCGRRQTPLSVTHLNLSTMNSLTLKDCFSVLKLFPNLKHLMLSAGYNDLRFMSATVWKEFISANLSQLKTFQFHFLFAGATMVKKTSRKFVYAFNNLGCSWLCAPVVMDYSLRLRIPMIEFYTSSQPSGDGVRITELYGTKRYVTVTNNSIAADKNTTQLRISINDDQVFTNEAETIYTKVTEICVHSQLKAITSDNYLKYSVICSDLKKLIPNLKRIDALNITSTPHNKPIYVPIGFVRRLLGMLPNAKKLDLPYHYLLQLLKFRQLRHLLTKQIDWLCIKFHSDPPRFEDLMKIIDTFSKNVDILCLDFYVEFPYATFYNIITLVMHGIFPKLNVFEINLQPLVEQYPCLTFNKDFKLWFEQHFTILKKVNPYQANRIEYKITDERLAVSFDEK